jgi:hypothetical protein
MFKKRKQGSGGKFQLNEDKQGLWIYCDGSTIALETSDGYGFRFSRTDADELSRVLSEYAETGEINTDGYEEFKEKPVVPIDWDSLSPMEKEDMKMKIAIVQQMENTIMDGSPSLSFPPGPYEESP